MNTREEVYKIIDEERTYQDTVRRKREQDIRSDGEKSIAEFLIYIRHTLNKADASVYKLDNIEAMGYVRKIAALSVSAMENFETPQRTMNSIIDAQ